jgi:hypothetical protein
MTVNNFYTPKIYDVTEQKLQEIEIWFNDAYGNQIPIRQVYQNTTNDSDAIPTYEIYQAAFKMECELAIISQQLQLQK